MKSVAVIVGLAASMLALPAAAQMNTSSLYAGAAIGQSSLKDACANIAGCDDKDTAWGVFAGWQFTPNIAAELGYHDLGAAKAGGSSYEANAIELVGVFSWPLGSQFSVYGKLGGFRGEVESAGISESNTDITFGLGAQWDMNRNLGFRVEWQRYPDFGGDQLVKSDADVLRLAALYRFR